MTPPFPHVMAGTSQAMTDGGAAVHTVFAPE